jgi:hypothetical protein
MKGPIKGMSNMYNRRFIIIDALKGFAITVVALYHFGALDLSIGGFSQTLSSGILPYGYLGVDIFFVISGFFFF